MWSWTKYIGFGRSDKVTDANWYNIAQHTANMKTLIEKLDLREITILVQDWGGPIGLAQAARMPERFCRLVIMNTWLHHVGYEYTPGILQWIEQWKPGGLLESSIPEKFSLGGLMVMATGRMTPQETLRPSLMGETPLYKGESADVKKAYDAVSGDSANQEENFALINALQIPVHFMWGVDDFVLITDWGRKWSLLIPHSTFEEIVGARHFLQDTHGSQIAARLLAHIG